MKIDKNVALVSVAGGVLAYALNEFRIYRKNRKREDARVEFTDSVNQLRAILMAQAEINEEILKGQYVGKTKDEIETDFKFRVIANRNKM